MSAARRRCGPARSAARAAAWALACGLVPALLGASSDEAPRPGQYCPLPRAGEKPRCLEPAESEFGEFFAALDEGEVSDRDAERVEAALADDRRDQEDFLALSSLTYGYYRLAQRAAADPQTDPEIAARLERWNRLLSAVYAREEDDDPLRRAVREAAQDLHDRAPAVEAECLNEDGIPVGCTSTEALLAQLDAADRVGVRGALARILGRWFGE